MAWAVLVAAGLFETAFAVFLKLSHGLTQTTEEDRIRGLELGADDYLRRKIENPASPRIIRTVLGGGYRLGLARGA